MEITLLDKFAFIILFTVLGHFTVVGQGDVSGTYIWTDSPNGYLVLSTDKSFKFKYRSHANWDLACGQYDLKGDTISFVYTSDMFDLACNTERYNMSDTTDYFLREGVYKSYRPILAKVEKNRILVTKMGNANEPETVRPSNVYYRKERKRGKRHAR